MCKQQLFSAAKISLAEKAVKMPLFAAFRFAYVNYARTKVLASGSVSVVFADDSHYTITKDGEMLLTYLVCPISPHSSKPSIWISAKNENEAIACYKKQVETFATLHAVLPF
jgi:hypothetical protein